MVMFVLLTLIGFVELERQLGEVGRGGYTLAGAFAYIALVLPRFAYEVFPVTALLGSLLGLGAMANHSELTAMRAAGVSVARIVWAAMKAGLLLMLAALLVGELLAPATEQAAQQMRAEAISGQITLKSRTGFWTRDGRAFINIRSILPDAELGDIYIYEYDDQQRLKWASHAERARHQGDHWVLENIRQSEFLPEEVRTRTLRRAVWKSFLDPALVDMLMVDPNVLPLWDLYRYITFLQENGQQAAEYEVAFWGKIVTPLVVLVMLVLAIPFVFGSLRTAGIGQRVFAGALVGVGFLVINKAFAQMAVVYQLNPLFAAAFPGVACLGVALWALRRV
jgi:lipopolysaccharide export system permease protein